MAKNDTEIFSKELLDQLLAGRDPAEKGERWLPN
jgi:hypothetical protein